MVRVRPCGSATAFAADAGATYVVTTDADGQYDPADIPALLAPIVADRADFVSGSRRLGHTYRGDGFRQLGVVFYAGVIRILTRQHITDPSFGLRAMRVEVPMSVTLNQPQFQASELLIGAALRGFRIAEVPAAMRARAAGTSRKDLTSSTARGSVGSWSRPGGASEANAHDDRRVADRTAATGGPTLATPSHDTSGAPCVRSRRGTGCS